MRFGGPRDGPFREPPPERRPPEPEAARADETTQWTMHLAELKEGEPALKLAGCRVAMPTKPTLSYWRALEAGDVSRVETLLRGGEDINQLGGAYGSTALGWAAMADNEDMLKVRAPQSALPRGVLSGGR